MRLTHLRHLIDEGRLSDEDEWRYRSELDAKYYAEPEATRRLWIEKTFADRFDTLEGSRSIGSRADPGDMSEGEVALLADRHIVQRSPRSSNGEQAITR